MNVTFNGLFAAAFLVVLTVTVIFFVQKCGNRNEVSQEQLQRVKDSIENELYTTLVAYNDFQFETMFLTDSLNRVIEDRNRIIDSADRVIKELVKKGESYKRQLAFYVKYNEDGEMVTVHNKYIDYCDSLADLPAKFDKEIEGRNFETNALVNELHKQLEIKNDLIQAGETTIVKLEGQVRKATQALGDCVEIKPNRNKLFIGPSVLGNQYDYIHAIGLGATFMTKKEQLIEADIFQVLGGKVMYKLGGKFKISFR